MSIVFSDREIAKFVQEHKSRHDKKAERIQLKNKLGHFEFQLALDGAFGNEYQLILRKNIINQFDFSIILAVQSPKSNKLFRLLRYNGNSHEHTNDIENTTFRDFHIHLATERYQKIGCREDTYAEPTARFCDFRGAFRCLVYDANIDVLFDPQTTLI